MAITFVANRGSGVRGATAGTNVAVTPSAAISAGNEVIAVFVSRQSVRVIGIEDAGSNAWRLVARYSNATNGNAHVEIWQSKVITGYSGAVTAQLSESINDCCIGITEYSVAAGHTLRLVASTGNEVNGANDFGSVTISNLPSKEYLWIRGLAKRANATTAITPTTNFTALNSNRSRNDATNAILLRGEYRIATATSMTSNPTLAVSGNTAGMFVAFEESAMSAHSPGTHTHSVATGGSLQIARVFLRRHGWPTGDVLTSKLQFSADNGSTWNDLVVTTVPGGNEILLGNIIAPDHVMEYRRLDASGNPVTLSATHLRVENTVSASLTTHITIEYS